MTNAAPRAEKPPPGGGFGALVLCVAAAGALAIPTMLSRALIHPGARDAGAVDALLEMDRAARAGDWDAAHGFFDLRAKGRALVPDLWDAAPEQQRAELLLLLKEQTRSTWEQNHSSDYFRAGTRLETEVRSPSLVLVRQVGRHEGVEASMDYWVERQGSRWRAIDRTFTLDGARHDSVGLVRVARGRIRSQLGREPDLGELVANLPTWLPRIRARTFKVELPSE